MILRSLATALRKQDWFTVVIETLIVVFGVFLGIQLGNWNEARETQERAKDFSERLIADLDPEAERILLAHGTEAPFCGGLLDEKRAGVFCCRLCGLPLFRTKTKFESGTGWPSFDRPYDPAHIREIRDTSFGMVRIETTCKKCNGHLGHIFDDGPNPAGLRYCVNSASMDFIPAGEKPGAAK